MDIKNSVDLTLQDSSDTSTDSTTKDTTESKKDSPEKYAEKMKARAEKAEARATELATTNAELTANIDNATDDSGDLSDAEIDKLAEDNDVDPDLIRGLAKSLESKISKTTEKLVDSKIKELKNSDSVQILNHHYLQSMTS